jgi:DEAD/DEAH box helicase domain-containing protein
MKLESAIQSLQNSPFPIVATKVFGEREGQYVSVPQGLHPEVRDWLGGMFPEGVYTHQAAAILSFLKGHDVGLMTPTASEKTPILQAVVAHLIKSRQGSKVLVMVPLMAMAKHEERSWKVAAEATGIKVGLIHEGIPLMSRESVLTECDVVLATADVIHSWFMSRLRVPSIRKFRAEMNLLILDEAHVYDRVFGANMAYLIARIKACGSDLQTICASAPLGQSMDFLSTLIGRIPDIIGWDDCGTKVAKRSLAAVRCGIDAKQSIAGVIRNLAASHQGQTLVFIEGRGDAGLIDQLIKDEDSTSPKWLAYKSLYEEVDQYQLQVALTHGTQKGLKTNSVIEDGIDIGLVELVIMIGKPKKMRSFWQRFGRICNDGEGVGIILDEDWPQGEAEFGCWLQTPLEPNWLPLENETLLLYSAMCVNHEALAFGPGYNADAFANLPASFIKARHLAANPEEVLEERHRLLLAPVAETDAPQYVYDLQSFEVNYEVKEEGCDDLNHGFLTLSQVFQEGFPGAVHHYTNRAFKVVRVDHRNRLVLIQAIDSRTSQHTCPIRVINAVTDFSGTRKMLVSDKLIVADVPMNLRDLVVGFTQTSDIKKESFLYGISHQGQCLGKTISTTGITIVGVDLKSITVEVIRDSYCELEGIHSDALAIAPMRWDKPAMDVPLLKQLFSGWAIADKISGSLCLSSNLINRWMEVLEHAQTSTKDQSIIGELDDLLFWSARMRDCRENKTHSTYNANLTEILKPGSVGFCVNGFDKRRIEVKECLFHPALGWSYRMSNSGVSVEWKKPVNVFPIPGISTTAFYSPTELKIVTGYSA